MDEHRSSLKDDLPAGHRNDIITADTRPTRSALVYLGETRPLSATDSAFMDGFFYRFIRDTASRALFRREVRFAAGPDTLWLPTQEGLIPDLDAEAHTGDTVTVFARWLGARQDGPQTVWLFVINEFATSASHAAWDRVFAECPPS